MEKLKKKLIRKLKDRDGMSLVEILCSIIVSLLASFVMILAINLSVKCYTKLLRESEAQTLYASLKTAIEDELRYAGMVTAFESRYSSTQISSYYSRSRAYGQRCHIVDPDQDDDFWDGPGRIYIVTLDEDGNPTGNKYYLLPESAYTYDLEAMVQIHWTHANQFCVDLWVYYTDSDGNWVSVVGDLGDPDYYFYVTPAVIPLTEGF